MSIHRRPHSMRVRVSHALAGFGILAAVAVGGAGPSSAAAATVSIGTTLNPASLTIAPATVVVWRNDDSRRHEIRSTSGPVEFRTRDLNPGESDAITFTTAGTYHYVDHRDQDNLAYHGSIVVQSSLPPPTAPPATNPPGGGGGGGTAPSPAPSTATVTMAGERYSPASVSISAGGTVTWLNNDSRAHTVTRTGLFDSGIMSVGTRFSRAFVSPGTYTYFCELHSGMRGTVVVGTAPGGGAPPAGPGDGNPPAGGGGAPPPGGGGTSGGGAAGRATISVSDNKFTPSAVTVGFGATVTFVHTGTVPHTATASNGAFSSGIMRPGATFSATLARPGSYQYFCDLHPGMRGSITVSTAPAGSGATGARASAPSSRLADPGGGETAKSGGARATVDVVDTGFEPPMIEVEAATTVVWTLAGALPHTITADDASFDSDILEPGATFEHTFSTPGQFAYYCTLHPGMKGSVTVVASGHTAAMTEATLGTSSDAAQGPPWGYLALGVGLGACALGLVALRKQAAHATGPGRESAVRWKSQPIGAARPVPSVVTPHAGDAAGHFNTRSEAWAIAAFTLSITAVALSIGALVGMSQATGRADEAQRKAEQEIAAADRRAARATAPTAAPAVPASASEAATVAVTLDELTVTTDAPSVPAGKVRLEVTNAGEAQHELVVLLSDADPTALTVDDIGRAVESDAATTRIGKIPRFDAGTKKAKTFNLDPGHYLLICNIPGHYGGGMRTSLTVT